MAVITLPLPPLLLPYKNELNLKTRSHLIDETVKAALFDQGPMLQNFFGRKYRNPQLNSLIKFLLMSEPTKMQRQFPV